MSLVDELIYISEPISKFPELVQGAGGNTSAKDTTGSMIIKASGFRLSEMTGEKGNETVALNGINEFLLSSEIKNNPDKELKEFVSNKIVNPQGFLPSMETGFHAVLPHYVVHTHPIWLNVFSCAQNSKHKLDECLNEFEGYCFIPYKTPGFYLSKAIAEQNNYSIYVLKNHGLITCSDSKEEAFDLTLRINAYAKKVLGVSNTIAQPSIKYISDNVFESNTQGLPTMVLQALTVTDNLSKILFPDQAVFLFNKVTISETLNSSKPVCIHPKTGTITYFETENKAIALEENIWALCNILHQQQKQDLQPQFLSDTDCAYLLNMDMEKYRQQLVK